MRRTWVPLIFAAVLLLACGRREGAASDTAAGTGTDTATTSAAATTTEAQAAVATDTTSPAEANRLLTETDHYKLWHVIEPPKVEHPIEFLGQFDGTFWKKATLTSLVFIGNPVEKTHEGGPPPSIRYPRLHLTGYAMDVEQPRRTVTLTNQFHRDATKWMIERATLFLVPAGKSLTAEPPPLPQEPGDHYACYQVIEAGEMPVDVRLVDQFDRRFQRTEQIKLLHPAYFCVPVQKRHGTAKPRPLWHPRVHLALYKIEPAQDLPRTISATKHDQFGPRPLRSRTPALLAVPTYKWAVDPPSPQ